MLSPLAALHVQQPRNVGPLEGATHVGSCGTQGEGPYVTIWLIIEEGVIRRVAYATHGCPSSIASASMLCQIAIGRTTEAVSQLTAEDLVRILGGLPEGKEHFAQMAVYALASASASALRTDSLIQFCQDPRMM